MFDKMGRIQSLKTEVYILYIKAFKCFLGRFQYILCIIWLFIADELRKYKESHLKDRSQPRYYIQYMVSTGRLLLFYLFEGWSTAGYVRQLICTCRLPILIIVTSWASWHNSWRPSILKKQHLLIGCMAAGIEIGTLQSTPSTFKSLNTGKLFYYAIILLLLPNRKQLRHTFECLTFSNVWK